MANLKKENNHVGYLFKYLLQIIIIILPPIIILYTVKDINIILFTIITILTVIITINTKLSIYSYNIADKIIQRVIYKQQRIRHNTLCIKHIKLLRKLHTNK